jgi:hypothetical protein
MSVLSLLRPRTPWGASSRYRRSRVTPAMPSTMSTSWLMVTSWSLPMFSGSRTSLAVSRRVPSRQSSM